MYALNWQWSAIWVGHKKIVKNWKHILHDIDKKKCIKRSLSINSKREISFIYFSSSTNMYDIFSNWNISSKGMFSTIIIIRPYKFYVNL